MGRGRAYKQQPAEQPWVSDGTSWRIWQGAYSPQAPRASRAPWQKDTGRGPRQPEFPGYTTISVRQDATANPRAVTDGSTPGSLDGTARDQLVPTTQSALNFARKAEVKVIKLQALKKERAEQWTLYEKKLKEAFQRERNRSAKDLEAISREIVEAERAQEEARAMLRTVVAESFGPPSGEDAPMEQAAVDAVFSEWAEEDQTTLHGVLQRALAPSLATPTRPTHAASRTPTHTAAAPVAPPTAMPSSTVPTVFPGMMPSGSPAPVVSDPYQVGTPTMPAAAHVPVMAGGPHFGAPPAAGSHPASHPPMEEPRSCGPSPTAMGRLQRRRAMHPFGRDVGHHVPPVVDPGAPENVGHPAPIPSGIRILEDDEDELDDVAADGASLS